MLSSVYNEVYLFSSRNYFITVTIARPSLTGQLITHLEARSIALKLLALSSTHVKVIAELCNEKYVHLCVFVHQ